MSFDAGRLFVGDVGQSEYEEINLVEKGGNYGWNVREGAHCYRADDCPSTGPNGEPLVDPIVEYPHGDAPVSGISVIGGAVYRGSALPGARGVYFFGDFQVKGRLFAATPPEGGSQWSTTTVELAGSDRLRRLRSFGRDADGELYVLGTGSDGGGLHRLVPAE
jgi:glucose/arabinose dehydrogenase